MAINGIKDPNEIKDPQERAEYIKELMAMQAAAQQNNNPAVDGSSGSDIPIGDFLNGNLTEEDYLKASGGAAMFSPAATGRSDVQADGVTLLAPGSSDVTVQPPNTSGTVVLSSALQGAERTEEENQQAKAKRENSFENGVLVSVAFNPADIAPTSTANADLLAILNGETPPAAAPAPPPPPTEDTPPETTGEGTLSVGYEQGKVDDTNPTTESEETDETGDPETDETDGNVNGSGNEENVHDSSNGNVDDESPTKEDLNLTDQPPKPPEEPPEDEDGEGKK